jgi:hypothetical protein
MSCNKKIYLLSIDILLVFWTLNTFLKYKHRKVLEKVNYWNKFKPWSKNFKSAEVVWK